MSMMQYSYYEIDDALYEFAYENTLYNTSNLAECALNFYNVLNYPKKIVDEELLDLDPKDFFPYDYYTLLEKSDGKYIDYIRSISELFTIDGTNPDVFIKDFYEDKNFEIRSMTFLAVELKCIPIDKYCTRNITKVISNKYGRPVFILFRHGNSICFGLPLKRKNKFDANIDTTQTQFISEWLNCLKPKYSDVENCSALCFDRLDCKNIGELYFSLFDALGYYFDRYTLEFEKKVTGRKYKKSKLDYEFDAYVEDAGFKYHNSISIDDIKEKFVYKKFGSGLLAYNVRSSSKNSKSAYYDKFSDNEADEADDFYKDTEDDYLDLDMLEYNEEDIDDSDSIRDGSLDEIFKENISEPNKNFIDKDNESIDSKIDTIASPDEFNPLGKRIVLQQTENIICMGSNDMEKELIEMITNNIYSLEHCLKKLGDLYREKSQEISLDLPLAARRQYINDLFDKEELISNNVSHIAALKQKLELMIKQLAPEQPNIQYDSEVAIDINMSTNYVEKFDNDIERLDNYSFTSPYKIIFLDQKIEVNNWTDVLLKVCEEMISLKPDIICGFDKSEVFKGRSRMYFSYNLSDLTAYAKQLSNGIFVETNFSANYIVTLCNDILLQCGFSKTDIEYHYKKRVKNIVEPLNDTNKSKDKQAEEKPEDIIYFSQKYGSLNITHNLMKSILGEILILSSKQKLYIDYSELIDTLSDKIKDESHYEQPQHVIRTVRMFLIDLGIISLFAGAKRGKYVLNEPELLKEMIQDKKIIVDLLNQIKNQGETHGGNQIRD